VNNLDTLHPTWRAWLAPALESAEFAGLQQRLQDAQNAGEEIYPPVDDRLRAFRCDPLALRAVILGQDPYHGPGQAHGLAFSVTPGTPVPRSLGNMFREIESSGGAPRKGRNGDLSVWERQGVLLLNGILTVARGSPLSHAGWGWQSLTGLALSQLSDHHPGLVFLLWGGPAQKMAQAHVDTRKHYCLSTSHPSPLSAYRGFLGSGHFSAANQWLVQQGHDPIRW
jgi:uracil-DNA glycosylase